VPTEKTNVPRSRKGAETRARLLAAAKRVFEERGFLEVRVTDITERAELSHGSFYHYFDSKEQIFREVAAAQEAGLTAKTDEARLLAAASDSPRERIRKGNRRYLERYRDEARIMGVIEQVSRYDAPVNAARAERQRHFAERSERAIRRMKRRGLIDARIDPALAATALGAMVARMAELWLVQGYAKYDFEHAVEQLTLLWANALGLPDEGARGIRARVSKPRGIARAPSSSRRR
jgi:AcrR family transcriptional regulator